MGREDKKASEIQISQNKFLYNYKCPNMGAGPREHLVPWAGFLQNLWFSGEGR